LCETHAAAVQVPDVTGIDLNDLTSGETYVTRNGRLVRLQSMASPAYGFYWAGVDPVSGRTIAAYSLSGTYFDPLLQMSSPLDIIARHVASVAETVTA